MILASYKTAERASAKKCQRTSGAYRYDELEVQHVCLSVCLAKCVYGWMYDVCVCVCMYVCVRMHICMCVFDYICVTLHDGLRMFSINAYVYGDPHR